MLKKPYYFMKEYAGTNRHGEKLYIHNLFQTLEEAKEWETVCHNQGRETLPIVRID